MAGPLRALRPDQIVPPISERPFTLAQRDTLAVLNSAMRPILGTQRRDEASLIVTTLADAPPLALERLGLARRDLDRALAPPSGDAAVPESAPEGVSFDPRPWVSGLVGWLGQLAMPGDSALSSWLAERQGRAVLLTPDPATPDDLWLLLGPGADPLTLGPLLAQARMRPGGPSGQLALLDSEGRWHSWHDKSIAPVLHEPLTLANFREVAGNYASWSPLYFGLVLFGLTFVSVALALAFVTSTRGKRKR